MDFPFDLYRLLPKPYEYFEKGFYFPLPKFEILRLLEKGLKEGLLKIDKNIIYPNFRLELAKKLKADCNSQECFEFIKNHSKENFYQASVSENFNRGYLKKFLEEIPLVKSYKYLSIGEGHCLVDCLIETTDLDKEQFLIFDIDEDIVNFYRKRGFKAFYGDARFLSDYFIPKAPFDIVFSYHIEFFQTEEVVSLANTNLKNYGIFYLAFASAELEDEEDFYSVFKTLWRYKFWIVEYNPFYIKAIKMENSPYWEKFFKPLLLPPAG